MRRCGKGFMHAHSPRTAVSADILSSEPLLSSEHMADGARFPYAGPRLVQAKDTVVDIRLWKKRHAQARVRREYRTADEVLAEAAERPQATPKQTIIDMRGPQVPTQAEQLLPYCHPRMQRTPRHHVARQHVHGPVAAVVPARD